MKRLLFSLTLFLSGCHFKHSYHSHPIPLACTDLAKKVERAHASGSFVDGELPAQAWWQLFGDGNLDQLVQIALGAHPDVKSAFAKVRLACQRSKEKRSYLFPQVDFNPYLLRQKISKTSPFFLQQFSFFTLANVELDFTYEIDLW